MKPLVLCILDGVGIRKEEKGNALKLAKTPNFDKLWKEYPHSLLEASGKKVGLPAGQMGNSEVGHTNIGAGRIAYQPLEFINNQIDKGTFKENQEILNIMNYTKENNSNLHILGLLSDGGIHSHINHLFNLIDMCKDKGINNIYLHIFTDGRDTKPHSGQHFIEQLEEKIKDFDNIKIATVSGRYYAMDRDNNYDRIKKAYDVIVNCEGPKFDTAIDVIKNSYENNVTDEFIIPAVVNNVGINDNDGLIVFNYRPDRLRCLFKTITNPEFKEFETKKLNIKLLTMMPVSDEVICKHAFELPKLDNTLGVYLSNNNIHQLRIAETEKYAHVTYFFDGGVELKLKNCDRILIPSPKVATYDLKPEMSAYEITDRLIEALEKDKYEVVILNYANGDMVGHTGNLEAAIKACEVLDECLGRLYNKVLEKEGKLIVTADHGNCEYMIDENGDVLTNHTTNKVPFIITDKSYKLKNGKLGDIAPTMLDILNVEIPKEMTGEILIKKNKISKKKIFIILSIIILGIIMAVYSYRLIHFYNLENGKEIKADTTLTGKILENNETVTKGSGLYQDNDNYIFKGAVENNYVYYSGKLWRILKINKNKSIKIISNDIVSSLVWNYENNNYENSYIRNWLNKTDSNYSGVFYDTLNNPENYLTDTTFCIDKLKQDDLEKCDDAVMDKVGLINYKEYVDAAAYKGYLNISKYFWTINGSDNKVWYVFNEGGISDKSYEGYSYGIRPTITLKSKLDFISGDGTKDNPYIIDKNELNSGSYINYSGYRWRIVSKDEEKIKIVMDEYIKDGENPISKAFSLSDSTYNINNRNNIGYYLNNQFYNNLENKELIVDGNWYNNSYNTETDYNYMSMFENPIVAKIGLLNVGEPYVTDLVSMTLTKDDDSMIYVTQENGTLYANSVTSEMNIRPAMYITNNIQIISGSGTQNDPYLIEGK